MKFKTAFLVCVGLMMVSGAFADSQIKYLNGDIVRVYGKIEFQNYGPVSSDQVCLDNETLRTTIPAHVEFVCDKGYWDHSDSAYPRYRCLKSRKVKVPARDIETPLSFTARECVKSVVDHSDSAYPRTTCLEYADVTKQHDLTYKVEFFSMSDYRMETPIKREWRKVGNCR